MDEGVLRTGQFAYGALSHQLYGMASQAQGMGNRDMKHKVWVFGMMVPAILLLALSKLWYWAKADRDKFRAMRKGKK